mgnify:CR=1 FL=1|tara:strand:- start:8624 stop:10450 length:1827 start_codon:yes stop_codon:yes gene_type:complete
MSKEKQLSESEANKLIEKNEREIDSKNISKKKKEEEEEEEDKGQEGFIGVITDKNRSPGQRVYNAFMILLNIILGVLLFLWLPCYLWFTLSKFEKVPGYSGNQVSGTDPFKPPYTKKAPAGVASASETEMAGLSFFSTRKHGWPYTWAQEPDDVGDGDFVWPNVIWGNTMRDMFNYSRNMFDGFLDLYKSFIGKIPPYLDVNQPNYKTTWWDSISIFFRLIWVFVLTVIFIAVGTGYLAKAYLGYWIGIPMISLFYATAMTFLDAVRMKECKDKAFGLLFSKLWWNTGYNDSGWFATVIAKINRLIYRGFLTSLFFSINMMISMVLLPVYGFYWLLVRPLYMPNVKKAAWYSTKKLISKYYLILLILIGFMVAKNWGDEIYPAWFKPGLMFWKGGPKWKGAWNNIMNQGEAYWNGIFKKIVVGYPYIIAFLIMLCIIIGFITGSNLIPRTGPKIERPTGLTTIPKEEFVIKKNEQWRYSGSAHIKYGMDGWRERWREQFKNGFKIQAPCSGVKPPSSSGGQGSTAGMQFGNAVQNAAMKQPIVQGAMLANTLANNPNAQKGMALATVAGAAGSLGAGNSAINALNTVNKVNNIRNVVKKGGRRKRRKK